MENVLFKLRYPAEFHAQTAVECAIALHPLVRDRLPEVAKIVIRTHESALRIIDKQGPLANPADRDHCLQYMVAVPLIHGRLTAADYEDGAAADPRIDALRARMECVEDKRLLARLSRSAQALGRQRDHRRVQRREHDTRICGRIPDRPPPAAPGRHTGPRSTSSGPTLPAVFRRSSSGASSTSRSMPGRSQPCLSTSSWI